MSEACDGSAVRSFPSSQFEKRFRGPGSIGSVGDINLQALGIPKDEKFAPFAAQIIHSFHEELYEHQQELSRSVEKVTQVTSNAEAILGVSFSSVDAQHALSLTFEPLLQKLREAAEEKLIEAYELFVNTQSPPRKRVEVPRARFQRSAVEVLNAWFAAHVDDPSPCDSEITELAAAASLTEDRVRTWFVNNRMRPNKALLKLLEQSQRTRAPTSDAGDSLNDGLPPPPPARGAPASSN